MVDVIIVGGGPAGSTLASYLSRAGIGTVLLEKALHPRPHVGESLVTSTTRIFDEIGFLETMEREGFVKKFGASWHPMNRVAEIDIAFREFPQEGVDQDYTYHVDRAKFDLLLLKHAESLGTRVYQGTHVKEVLFDQGRAVGVRTDLAGEDVRLAARVVVDATGRDTLLGRQLRIKRTDPIFNQYAVHAWFEGVDRGDGPTADHIHIHFLPVDRGWAWQIPISEEVTSVGIVVEREVLQERKLEPACLFEEFVHSNPNLAAVMRSARRIDEYKAEGDYSYAMDRFVGNNFMLVGDAARFVDPIFSSGVSVALSSAKFASETLMRAFELDDFSEEVLAPYEAKLRSGVEVWYEFIRMYYKLLPMFTRFIQADDHRYQVLELLQGEVYERENVPVLDAMREFIRTVESTEGHLLRGQLSSVPID